METSTGITASSQDIPHAGTAGRAPKGALFFRAGGTLTAAPAPGMGGQKGLPLSPSSAWPGP